MKGLRSSSAIGDYGTPVALRCLYTDLDGTLLGRDGNLFGDADGNFSRTQALMLEACHRAGVEVVIMSGRREDTVRSDSRLIGQTSYIYEAGCAMVIDRERTYLTGEWLPDRRGQRRPSGSRPRGSRAALRALRPAARVARALAHRPRALAAVPRQGRRRGGQRADRRPGRRRGRPALPRQRRDRPADGGDRGDPRLPPGPRRGEQGQGRRRAHAGPRLRAGGVHRRGRLARGPRRRRVREPLLLHGQRAPRGIRCCARPPPGWRT